MTNSRETNGHSVRTDCEPSGCVGTVYVRRSDFEHFKALLGKKLINPGFSWNEKGEVWVSVERGLPRDVLNGKFKVVEHLVADLNRIRHAPASLWPTNKKGKPATHGFYVHGDLICRKRREPGKERTCLARLEMAES